jgi:rRNA maturation endonuclease Nob1
MYICKQCRALYDKNVGLCIECGGEVRRRTISEGLEELLDAEGSIKTLCPKCGDKAHLIPPFDVCERCYHKLIAEKEGKEDTEGKT